MNPYEETFSTWNMIAQLYQDKFMDLDLYDDTYAAFCQALPQHARVLEIGCGPGNITRYLLNKRPDLRIEGIDIAPNMIELARQNNPGATFKVMDCRNIDQLEPTYNGIIAGFCLPYLSEVDSNKLVADCRHLIAGKGAIYLSYIEGVPERSGYQNSSSGDRVYFYYHQSETLQAMLKENGFSNLQMFQKPYTRDSGISEWHSILLAEAK